VTKRLAESSSFCDTI